MAPQPAHDRIRVEPFWRIQCVFAPEGGGADFSYTIGLATRGSPELHLWTRPSLGEDPGQDWAFSMPDCCAVLNELAELVLRGEIGVGSVLTRQFDGGRTTVELRIDPPEDRRELQALLVPPDADVLPVRWSLRRERAAGLVPLAAEVQARAHETWAELAAELDRRRRLPEDWAVPRSEPSFAPGQRFGPLTALVVVRGARLLHADADTIGAFLDAVSKVDAGGELRWPIAHARTLAEPLGRVEQLHALESSVDGLVAQLTRQAAWRELVDDVFSDLARRGRHEELSRATATLADLLRVGVLASLSTQAVADVAGHDLLLAGTGAWEAAFAGHPGVGGDDAGRRGTAGQGTGRERWLAAPHVVEVVRATLRRRSAETLSKIGLMHDMTLRWDSVNTRARRYSELESRLTGWALASPAACPPVLALLEGTTAGAQLAGGAGPGLGGSRLVALQEWATCVTSILTHRQRLTAEEVELFAWPLHSLLPGLARILNEPLAFPDVAAEQA